MLFPTDPRSPMPNGVPGIFPPSLEHYRIAPTIPLYQLYEWGELLSQLIEAREFKIQHHVFIVNRKQAVFPMPKRETVSLFFMLQNNVDATLSGIQNVPLVEEEMFGVELNMAPHDAEFLPSYRDYVCMHLDITKEQLWMLSKSYKDLQPIIDRLAERNCGVLNTVPVRMTPVTHYFLDLIRYCRYEPAIAQIYLRPVCIALFRQYAKQCLLPDNSHLLLPDLSEPMRVARRQLNYIIQKAARGLDMEQLILEAGVNADAINSVFVGNYFLRAEEIITHCRMEAAFALIRRYPADQRLNETYIARQCGYTDVHEFTAAFVACYDLWPDELHEIR